MLATTPLIKWWGRMTVSGVEMLPTSGPTLIVGNHDSYWDPVAVGIAGRHRRQIRALAKSSLWDVKPLAPILNGMGQIPIRRGEGDAAALAAAIEQLQNGACIGIFPEGTRALGRELRPRSGVGRLALEVPEATLVCVAVRGTVDVASLPGRPDVDVEFFLPEPRQIILDGAMQAIDVVFDFRKIAAYARIG